ncbi:pentatricopeptide repeat-containing protein At3g24000, mitochondrial [Cryptomeria japonica]|uniref:pentatricopeptide repeat-containing protein At3g24000, mitochondrial n=1 Tax=Cryptomeria japonica TaxID=3369 RepID=UPI0027DA9326|nr:pentatricopeptide repeat-containing protein At3g24000, mitochondrial [Cryptomeria japonica]
MLPSVQLNFHIRAFCREGCVKEALHILLTTHNPFVGSFTYLHLLQTCSVKKTLSKGRQFHSWISDRGFTSSTNRFLQNTLINMYDKCGSLVDARNVFNLMKEPNVFSWNMIIAAYGRHGFPPEAFTLFHQMQRTGIQPDQFTFSIVLPVCVSMVSLDYGLQIHGKIIKRAFQSNVLVLNNTLIDMYAKCGSIQTAHELFDKMPQRDVVSWTAIIAGYAQNGLAEKALEISKQMQLADVRPDSATFASILPACGKLGALEQGMEIHQRIIESGFLSDTGVTALIDMYAKCGNILKARELFDKIHQPDVASWTAIIAGYAMHGYSKDALKVFEQMKHSRANLDHVSFLCVLYACSHAGLVDEGCQYFKSMSDSYCIMPTMDHYKCMVDLLGRAGYLEEALNFMIKMAIKPDVVMWMCLLGACRSHKNKRQGEFVATLLFQLDPEISAPYVLLSNIYAEVGRWADVLGVRKLMKDKGIKKIPGCSWIEVHKIVHVFYVGDRSHPQTHEIYAELEKLSWEMRVAGYIPDTKPVLKDVEEEEKISLLCHHSEKLAIAFGLLNTTPRTTIRVVKNLRVCGDCHTATKFISKIVAREIVMRDANRFHHFKHGQCSCGDYW